MLLIIEVIVMICLYVLVGCIDYCICLIYFEEIVGYEVVRVRGIKNLDCKVIIDF